MSIDLAGAWRRWSAASWRYGSGRPARVLTKTEGYTIEELFGSAPATRARKAAPAAKAPSKTAGRKLGKVAPKYRNPANPKETWTGRGKQPRWMAELTAKGNKKPEDFLIKKA